jgi:CspA family cold shock protein
MSMRGKVKWFNDRKGWGFIVTDEYGDVFVHHSSIEMDGFRTLEQDEEVSFEIVETPKGLQASNVSRPSAQ